MRARGRHPEIEVPARLARFAAAEWPGEWGEAFAAWRSARRVFVAQHGDRTELGDMVDLISGEVQAKRLAAPPEGKKRRK